MAPESSGTGRGLERSPRGARRNRDARAPRRRRARRPDPHDSTSAYLDPGARDLVARARARRLLVDRSIRAYDVTVRERIAVGLRALRRDRMVYRRELALHVSWRRDTVGEIRVLGA